jgi:hypothetical protein
LLTTILHRDHWRCFASYIDQAIAVFKQVLQYSSFFILSLSGSFGEMSERFNVPDSKSGVLSKVPGVRIPLSPPEHFSNKIKSSQIQYQRAFSFSHPRRITQKGSEWALLDAVSDEKSRNHSPKSSLSS